MLLEEYNETELMELFKEEGREEGREEERKSILKSLINGYMSGSIELSFAAQLAGMSPKEFLQMTKSLSAAR